MNDDEARWIDNPHSHFTARQVAEAVARWERDRHKLAHESWHDGAGRKYYELGERAVANWLAAEGVPFDASDGGIVDVKRYRKGFLADVTVAGLVLDAKNTYYKSVTPWSEMLLHVLAQQIKNPVDVYIWTYFSEAANVCWVVGCMTAVEFLRRARYLREGDPMPPCGYPAKTTSYYVKADWVESPDWLLEKLKGAVTCESQAI